MFCLSKLAAFACLSLANLTLAIGSDQPNVLLIFVDDLRPQTRDYGHQQMQTPNFDRLAASGLRFENAYCQVPTCGASRASLFTALYPTRERFPNFLTWAEKDAVDVKTLPQRFKESGYTTLSNGKVFHHPTDTQARSWSEPAWRPKTTGRTLYNDASLAWLEKSEQTRKRPNGKIEKKVLMWEAGDIDTMQTHDGLIAQKTINDLERMATSDQPFFIACGFAKPHMPFLSPKSTYDQYPLGDVKLAEHRKFPQPKPPILRRVTEQNAYIPMAPDLKRNVKYNSDEYHRRMRQGYYASVSHADELTGRVLDKLGSLGLADNTYVVVIGDHGWLLGEHNQWAKNTLLHDALRTAMWMSGPNIAKGASVPSFVEFVDIHPTLCELAGIDFEPSSINGKSFAAVLKTPAAPHRDHAYTRFKKGDSVASKDYHYVLWKQDNGKEQALLIDRATDPLGKTNCSGDPKYEVVEKHMRFLVDAKISAATETAQSK